MYCPNCGKEIVETQRFCRSCGYSFQQMLEMLARQTDGRDTANAADKRLKRRRKKIELAGVLTVVSSLILACFFLVIAGLLGFRIGAAEIVAMSGVCGAILLTGAGILVYGGQLPTSADDEFEPDRALPSAKKTNELAEPSSYPGIPSVTETTTRKLAHSNHKDS